MANVVYIDHKIRSLLSLFGHRQGDMPEYWTPRLRFARAIPVRLMTIVVSIPGIVTPNEKGPPYDRLSNTNTRQMTLQLYVAI